MQEDIKRKEIAIKIQNWAYNNLGSDFEFREYQLDSAAKVVQNVLDNKKIIAAELPCGAGKSYIAMCVAGVLAEQYNKTTYILVSDVSLFKQYEKDVKKYNLDWGVVCGKDNYICKKNGLPFSSGSCQLKDVSLTKLLEPSESYGEGFQCASSCRYVTELKKALKAKVVVMTYQLWFISNFLLANSKNVAVSFAPKDLVICDEAHKLAGIVQSTFSPKIDISKIDYYQKILDFAKEEGIEGASDIPEVSKLKETFNAMSLIYNSNNYDPYNKNDLLYKLFLRYKSQLSKYVIALENTKEDAKNIKDKAEKGKYFKIVKMGGDITNDYSNMRIFNEVISRHGIKNFVPSLLNENEMLFNCACEADLVKETFHYKANAEFLMSATLGNLDVYLSLIGADDYIEKGEVEAFEVPSTFDFTKSPIYYTSNCRMSFREKEASLPALVNYITDICNKYKGEHGIIHTGSYSLSKEIFDRLPPDIRHRIVFYDSSKKKQESLSTFKNYMGKILMGPSILEGLSFDDDLSRFCIIAKVPYPSLNDNLVKAKMNLYDNWYSYTTINSIIQGVGRSIRSKEDYADTYILDGCFNTLYHKDGELFPSYFKERMQYIS